MRRTLFLWSFVALLTVGALGSNTVMGPVDNVVHPSLNQGGRLAASDFASSNWSGYVVKANSAVIPNGVGDWVVPEVDCSFTKNGNTSVWVGDGGFVPNDTLYQTGTESVCANGKARYYAWWEIVPGYTEQVWNTTQYPVAPRDHIQGIVYNIGGKTYLTLNNFGAAWGQGSQPTKWNVTKIVNKPASRSFECILERPDGNPRPVLSDFGTAVFPAVTGIAGSIPGCEAVTTSGVVVRPAWSGQPTNAGITSQRVLLVNGKNQPLVTVQAPTATGGFVEGWVRSS